MTVAYPQGKVIWRFSPPTDAWDGTVTGSWDWIGSIPGNEHWTEIIDSYDFVSHNTAFAGNPMACPSYAYKSNANVGWIHRLVCDFSVSATNAEETTYEVSYPVTLWCDSDDPGEWWDNQVFLLFYHDVGHLHFAFDEVGFPTGSTEIQFDTSYHLEVVFMTDPIPFAKVYLDGSLEVEGTMDGWDVIGDDHALVKLTLGMYGDSLGSGLYWQTINDGAASVTYHFENIVWTQEMPAVGWTMMAPGIAG